MSGIEVWPAPLAQSGSGGAIQDEGVDITARTKVNFAGAGVTAADDSANDRVTVTIPGGGGSAYLGPGSAAKLLSTYGAVGDGKVVVDGAITSGAAILTSATAAFVPGDVGKSILVSRAGAAGAHLVTTILSRTNSTTVVLSANAGTTVTGAYVSYGTDDTAAIILAINAVFNAGGGVLYGGDLNYIVAGALQSRASAGNVAASLVYNAQIPLPAQNMTKELVTIELAGAFDMSGFPASGNPGNQFSSKGMRLISHAIGGSCNGSTWSAVLGGSDYFGSSGTYTNVQCNLRNLEIVTPENPSLAAAQFFRTSSASVEGCAIRHLGPQQQTTDPQPTNPSGHGLVMPGGFCLGPNRVRKVLIMGQYGAFWPGEHTTFEDLYLQENFVGISLKDGGDHLIKGTALVQANTHNLAYANPASGVAGADCKYADIRLDTESFSVATYYPAWAQNTTMVKSTAMGGSKVSFFDEQHLGAVPNVAGTVFPKMFDWTHPRYVIGAAGMPAFLNGFIANASGYDPPAFFIDESGICHLTGVVACSSNQGSGTNIFQLPAPWRTNSSFNLVVKGVVDVVAFGSAAVAPLIVFGGGSAGFIQTKFALATTQLLFLDGISFPVSS